MNFVPRRNSLSTQVLKVLHDGLTSGAWSEWLPGERSLCERLNVSRPTIRAALRELRREGLIEVAHGRRSRIVRRPATFTPAASKVVCVLSPVPLHTLRPFVMFLVDEAREYLAEAGYRLEVEASPRYYTQRPYKALEGLVQEKSVACWTLFRATAEMQTWFGDRGLPVVVSGSPHPGIRLPSVDLDYRAICRHGGATLLSKGHRHIALLVEHIRCAGDDESRDGFLEAGRAVSGFTPRITIGEHNGSVAGICAKLDSLMRLPSPPTGLLVANSMHVLTVMGHLFRSGIKIPGDVALISRDDDAFLKNAVPAVARYSSPPAQFARKAAHLILLVARGGAVPQKRVLLVPDLVKGETLA